MSPTPPMPTPPTPPRYSAADADHLVAQLKALADKLTGLGTQRKGSVDKNLGQNDHHTLDGRWLGTRRDDFDGKFGGQQSALADLAAKATALIGAVQAATAAANAKYALLQKQYQADMNAWRADYQKQ